MYSKKAKEVTRVTMDMLLRLRADGFHKGHIHGDQGHEFQGQFKVWRRERGIHLTRTPGDDPRSNGRAECAVKTIKPRFAEFYCELKLRDLGGPGQQGLSTSSIVLLESEKGQIGHHSSTVMVRNRKWRRGIFEVSTEGASTCARHLKTMVIGSYLKVNALASPSSS